jgi:uncharacterized protein (DUF849 family)
VIQAALNGDRTKTDLATVPVSMAELAADAIDCVAAGAGAMHLHPRDASGHERLDADIVNAVANHVRAACGVPISVTTGEWIEPDLATRLRLVRGWTAPDETSVNISEPGSIEMMQLLLEIGVGIEAGVWTVEDAIALGESGLGNRVTRVLVEPGELQVGTDIAAAVTLCADIHAALDQYGITVPRLQHADGAVTWAVLEDAFRRGIDTRIGLEDTLLNPDGSPTSGNAELVRHAAAIQQRLAV